MRGAGVGIDRKVELLEVVAHQDLAAYLHGGLFVERKLGGQRQVQRNVAGGGRGEELVDVALDGHQFHHVADTLEQHGGFLVYALVLLVRLPQGKGGDAQGEGQQGDQEDKNEAAHQSSLACIG